MKRTKRLLVTAPPAISYESPLALRFGIWTHRVLMLERSAEGLLIYGIGIKCPNLRRTGRVWRLRYAASCERWPAGSIRRRIQIRVRAAARKRRRGW